MKSLSINNQLEQVEFGFLIGEIDNQSQQQI